MSAATYSRGFACGLVAFGDGRAAVPALDPAVLAHLADVPLGGGLDFLRGWVAGWHSANLMAPLPAPAEAVTA